jgi:outer membrane protein
MLLLYFVFFATATADASSSRAAALPVSQPASQPPEKAATIVTPLPAMTVTALSARYPLLTLAQAVEMAEAYQPSLRAALLAERLDEDKVEYGLSALTPQLTASARATRTSANFLPSPGTVPLNSVLNHGQTESWTAYDSSSLSATATQLIIDGAATLNNYRSSLASLRSQKAQTETSVQQLVYTVRNAYFTAVANKALVGVASDTLKNYGAHLDQIKNFVEVGTKSLIDLIQTQSDYANAKYQLITAQNNYATAKAQLVFIIGNQGSLKFDVEDKEFPALLDENQSDDALMAIALKTRPEMKSYHEQVRANELLVDAAIGGFFPVLSAQGNLTFSGLEQGHPTSWASDYNWSAGLVLGWTSFNFLESWSLMRQAQHTRDTVAAQMSGQEVQIRLDVEQAWLAVQAGLAQTDAAGETLLNAKEQLTLAEGRYQTGVGSIIELGDAQVAETNAAAQVVSARFNLSSARALLAKALGRI